MKLAWVCHFNLFDVDKNRREQRAHTILKQLTFITTNLKILNTSNYQSIEKIIYWKLYKGYIPYIQDTMIASLINVWFWANHNHIDNSLSILNENLHVYTYCLASLKRLYPVEYYLEF